MGSSLQPDSLNARLKSLGKIMVAYSGGVDSAFLAWAAHEQLADGMLAVIADSPSLARTQLADALLFAEEQRIPVAVGATDELANPAYAKNDGARCFFSKDDLFTVMEQMRAARGFDAVPYGVNVDDQGEVRPGQKP